MQSQMGGYVLKTQKKDLEFNKKMKILEKDNSSDTQTLLIKLEKMFMNKYSQQQKRSVYQLMEKWTTNQLEQIISNEKLFFKEFYEFYRQNQLLSARVYDKIQKFIKTIDKSNQKNANLLKFFQILKTQRLQFSFDRLFLSKRNNKFANRFNDLPNQNQLKKQQQDNLKCVESIISTSKCPVLNQIFSFMKQVQLISFELSQNISNNFMAKMQAISHQQQRQLYFQSMKVPFLEQLIQIRNKSKNDSKLQSLIWKKYLPNYHFYQQSIQSLHKQQGNYHFLQSRHDYIQLMFPNHYGSSFNSSARPLNYIQSRLFEAQYNIGLKMLKSIVIFFDFMGIKIDNQSFSLQLISPQRLKQALFINTHNHLRVMRILACLSVIGFRKIALKLIEFLDVHTQKGGLLEKFRKKFENNWRIYGDQAKYCGKNMCFLQSQDYPPDHIVLKKKQQIEQSMNKPELKQQMVDQDNENIYSV